MSKALEKALENAPPVGVGDGVGLTGTNTGPGDGEKGVFMLFLIGEK